MPKISVDNPLGTIETTIVRKSIPFFGFTFWKPRLCWGSWGIVHYFDCHFAATFLSVWDWIYSVISNVLNLCIFYDAMRLNFILEPFFVVSLPVTGLQAVGCCEFHGFPGHVRQCKLSCWQPVWPWTLYLPVLCWVIVFLVLNNRCENVSKDVMPTLGCWRRSCH